MKAVWYARLKTKYTSSQQATLVNDEEVPAYTLVGLMPDINSRTQAGSKNQPCV
jgi:hypothetical protein